MTSKGCRTRSPAEFAAAALRRAIVLPLALSTVTGALTLGFAEHVRMAVVGKIEDEHELRAINAIYRRLRDDQMAWHRPGWGPSDHGMAAQLPADVDAIEKAAQRHARIATNLRSLSSLARQWMRERQVSGLPPDQAATQEKRLLAMDAEIDAVIAALQADQVVDEATVRRRFAEMLTLVAVLSISLGVIIALYVRRDLVVVARGFKQKLADEQETNRIKDEFVAILSHELKTPINAILGWTTLLRRRPDDPTTSRRALDRIERNARRQARLIDDIVDMSCIVTGRLRLSFHPVDVAALVQSAVASAQAAADTKGVGVAVAIATDAGSIWADPQRAHQILNNLVDNAVKYAPAGGRVIVGASRSDHGIKLRVSDSGQGLRGDFVPHAFEAFRQSDPSSSRAHGGLGLGLAIVQRLVDLHQGTVDVESPGEAGGATFVVTLPARPPDAAHT